MAKKIIIFGFILITLFLTANLVFAETTTTTLNIQVPFGSIGKQMQIDGNSIGTYIKAVIAFTSAIIIVIAIIMIMASGVQWIMAAGDSGKISKAKEMIIKAVTGLAIALFAVFILQLVNPQTTIFNPIIPEEIQGTPTLQENKPCASSEICGPGLFCAKHTQVCTAKLPSTNESSGACFGTEISGNHDLACLSNDCQIITTSYCNSGQCCGGIEGSSCSQNPCSAKFFCASGTKTCMKKVADGGACWSGGTTDGNSYTMCESGFCTSTTSGGECATPSDTMM